MPTHEHMHSCVLVDGVALHEYLPPEDEQIEPGTIVRYVEATVGKRFTVGATWLPGFNLRNASALYSEIKIDDNETIFSTPTPRTGLKSANGVLGQQLCNTWNALYTEASPGLVKKLHYTFGALEISDSVELNKPLTSAQVKNMGEIRLTFRRGGKVTWFDVPLPLPQCPIILEAVPEKLMKGRELKNNVRYEESDAEDPYSKTLSTDKDWDCGPLRGKFGTSAVFVFKYRSRKILQRLGCIPRSPSPEPDYALMYGRQEGLIKEAKQKQRMANLEILKLREENLQLKKQNESKNEPRGVKRERVDNEEEIDGLAPATKRVMRAETTQTIAPEARGVKREREVDNDEIEELAPPPKRPLLLVDLTEDE